MVTLPVSAVPNIVCKFPVMVKAGLGIQEIAPFAHEKEQEVGINAYRKVVVCATNRKRSLYLRHRGE
jgi:hypothetical protein